MQAYGAAALALGRARSSVGLMRDICDAITGEPPFVLAFVGFAGEGMNKPIRIAGSGGPSNHYLDGLKLSWSPEMPLGRGPIGVAIRTGSVQVIEDTETDAGFRPWRERARRNGFRSVLTAPFPVEGDGRGVLAVYSSKPHSFGPVLAESFTHLAEEIGIGLRTLLQEERLNLERAERERTQQGLVESLAAVVGAMTTAMEIRDPYTAGHQNRVAELACAIGQEMGWTGDRLKALRVAAQVHDIGKVSISAEILTKTTRLSAPEWSLIKEHAEKGYAIMRDVRFHWPVAEAVRQHHERLDGSGYPKGLKGEEILLEARILAVADVVESMASARPYRLALGLDVALCEVESQAGTLLDADVVRICVSLFREKGFAFSGKGLHE